jgi:hypothetical protein
MKAGSECRAGFLHEGKSTFANNVGRADAVDPYAAQQFDRGSLDVALEGQVNDDIRRRCEKDCGRQFGGTQPCRDGKSRPSAKSRLIPSPATVGTSNRLSAMINVAEEALTASRIRYEVGIAKYPELAKSMSLRATLRILLRSGCCEQESLERIPVALRVELDSGGRRSF